MRRPCASTRARCRQVVALALATLGVSSPLAADIHRYALNFADDLQTVEVTAELARPGLALTARNAERLDLIDIRTCQGERLRRGRSIQLAAQEACVRYQARLTPADRNSGFAAALPSDVMMTSPSTWLWIPDLGVGDGVQLEVTSATHISAPWQREAGRYRFGASPRSSRGLVLLGAFDALVLEGIAMSKPVAYIGPEDAREKVKAWLIGALGATNPGGEICLPNPDMHVVVVDVGPRGRSPVPFGHVIRDQGETVRLFIDSTRSLEDFLYDWTAVHEFAHLRLPYVTGRQKWISEGFASYYQNVLQARAGFYGEAEAWQRLTRSFARAAESGRDTSPNGTASEEFWRVRMMVYWSGAALALHADAELREQSGGAKNLDSVLALLAECCLPSGEVWQGRRLFALLDELAEAEVFVPLFDRYADALGMPPTEELMASLGVVGQGERASLDDSARLAHIRRMITAPHPCGANSNANNNTNTGAPYG